MTLILLIHFLKNLGVRRDGFYYYFPFLIFMLYSNSITSQVVSDFTTISSSTGCGSLVVEFEDLSTGNPDTWIWDFGNGNTSNIQHPTVIYQDTGLYTVKLIASNINSSDERIQVDFIRVYANPSPSFTQNLTEFCVPLDVTFIDQSFSSSNILSWMWDFGDGGSSNLENPTYNYVDDGVYTVSLSVEDDNGCEEIFVFNDLIHAKAVPVSSFISDINITCESNQIINFTNLSTGSVNYNWDFGDGQNSSQINPSHNYSSGTYSVTLISNNGICSDTLVETNFLEVGLISSSDFTSDFSSVCENQTISFSDLTLNNPDNWLWDFGDGVTSTIQDPYHTYIDPGIYTVRLTTSINGECTNTLEMIDFIEIFSEPIVNFSADSTYSCDLPFNVHFIDNTSNAVSWNWHFENGDSSNIQNPIISFNSYDSFDVQLEVIDINGCSSISSESNYISTSEMELKFFVSDSIICESDIVLFTDSSVSSFPITSYLWDFGDGQTSTIQHPQHQFNTISVFDISLYLVNTIGCRRDQTMSSFIKTVGPPNANFVSSTLVSCAGEDINFIDLTTSPDIITNWIWNFGDSNISELQNPVYQYNMVGTYDITLIAGEGNCTDTITMDDYIKIIEPSSFFEAQFNCTDPLQVEFINLSQGADNVIWDFDDGTTSTQLNPVHTFPSRGIYQVSLTVTNNATNCSHEFVKKVRVTVPEANFTYLVNSNNSLEDSVICAPQRVYLENLSIDCSYYKVKWEDGYTGYGRLDHLFTDPGIWDVSIIITDIHRCKDTFTINNMYRVNSVRSDFGISNISGCDSLVIDFMDLSSVNSDLLWVFGDGDSSTLSHPQHVYSDTGYYDVTLYSTSVDGCKDTSIKEQYVKFIHPKINIRINDDEICKNMDLLFTDSSEGISLNYLWDFGDGHTSNQTNPTYIYSSVGVFPISVIITDTFTCSATEVIGTITVQDVIADFSSSLVSSDCPPLITTFTNQSIGNVSNYHWSFGDGLTSSQENPSHLYSSSGNYDVELIIEDNFNCTDTLIFQGMISIFGPTGDFSFSENLICSSDSVDFTANVQNTDLYLWDFGDGVFSTDSNPTHVYYGSNYFHPILVIENSLSCQLIVQSDDSIKVVDIVVDAGLNQSVCLGDSIAISANGNASEYIWDNSVFILDQFEQNTLAFPDTSSMFYITNTDGLCRGTDSIYISVIQEIPDPNFTTINNCYQDSMLLIGDAGMYIGNFDWEWDILGNNLLGQNTYFQFDTVGEYVVELTVRNLDNNCDATIQKLVEVIGLPLAHFRADQVCFGEETNFTNLSSQDVVSCVWSFGDGYQSSFDFNPVCLFSEAGVFNSTLLVVSDKGCLNSISQEVVVNEIPEAQMSISEACHGSPSIFNSFNLLSDVIIKNWIWDYGDNSLVIDQENTDHLYSDYGEYNVTLNLVSSFGCKNTIKDTAIVHPNPDVSFLVEELCEGDLTRFTNNSNLIDGTILSYNWNFGDGNMSILENTSNQFLSHGSYLITLNVTSTKNCSSSSTQSIQIHELPEVDFLVDNAVCEDMNVNFLDVTNSDDNIISWEWNFGDRNISILQHPIHIYHHPGIYDVFLSVKSDFGCESNIIKEDYITVYETPISSFEMTENKVSLLNSEIIFTNTSHKDLYFEWDFDNGETNTLDTVVSMHFNDSRIYLITLYVENEMGCFDEAVNEIEVEEDFSIFIPTAFTPNGDGLNDIFQAKANGTSYFQMSVYNRWGELIYFSDDINLGWDGSNRSFGEMVENGTYMYHIYLTDYNDKPWVYNGELNLIK